MIMIIIVRIIILILLSLLELGRTGWRHGLPRQVERSRPAESVVATMASANKPTATPVRVTAQARYGSVKTWSV